mgnify:CR=1 FL=1|jgi:hypothetical protein|tara:strand:- start:18156 stop:18380 length:225 start_codon:yes stop_codon:yes gene_type:complete
MARITHWTIKIMWDDGKEEFLDDIPNYVASPVDDMLDTLEQLKTEIELKERYEENRGTNKRSSEGRSPVTTRKE